MFCPSVCAARPSIDAASKRRLQATMKGWVFMTLEVETVLAAALMMAVFSAVAAIGTSIVLGVGFERLRAGFEIVSRQTGFFSDAIHKLEKKVEQVDEHTTSFNRTITVLESKVANVGEQANAFTQTVQSLEKKVEIVDKQTGFFSDALHKLERKIDVTDEHEQIVAEKLQAHSETDLISTGKAEALVAHAENLLTQMSTLAEKLNDKGIQTHQPGEALRLTIPSNYVHGDTEPSSVRYH